MPTTAINVSSAAGLTAAGILVDEAGVSTTLAIAGVCTAAGLLVALLAATAWARPLPGPARGGARRH